jgi:dTDP-L-rhamnose 4-epimerase
MNFLVTGGAGFIGANLCKKLISEGHQVWVIDNLSPQVHGDDPTFSSSLHMLPSQVTLIIGDFTDLRSYASLGGVEFDVLIHLAAETGTGQSMYNAKKYFDVNVSGMAFLNDLIVNKHIQKPKQIILASSRAIYGEAVSYKDIALSSEEKDEPKPKSVYALTKLMQEQILTEMFDNINDINTCALRFQNVYGPGQSLKNPYTGIISIFTTAIKNNKPIQIFEDGLMTRDFIYVEDVVDAIILCSGNKNVIGKVYNVGSGVQTTVLDVAKTLASLINPLIEIKLTGEKRKGDIRHNFADITNIKRLGFIPKFDFASGLNEFLKWQETQNTKESNYDKSLDEMRKVGLLK